LSPLNESDPPELSDPFDEACKQIGCDRDAVHDIVACNPAQIGLWVTSQKTEGTYVTTWSWSLENVNHAKLKECWREAAEFNSVLRVRIVQTQKYGLAMAITNIYPSWTTHTLEGSEPEMPVFETGKPLFYYQLRQSSEGSWKFHLIAHHAIYDRWSLHLILEDVRRAYEKPQSLQNRPSPSILQDQLSQGDLDDSAAFWQQGLEATEPAQFPANSPSVPQPRTNQSALEDFAFRHKSSFTDATIITAAWSILLQKYCNTDTDLSFGFTTWGRHSTIRNILDLSYPAFSTVPFLAPTIAQWSVEHYLRNVQARLSDTSKHQRLGLPSIAKLGSKIADSCKFSNVLVIQSKLHSSFPNTILGSDDFHGQEVQQAVGLLLECTIENSRLSIHANYDSRLLSAKLVSNLVYQLHHTAMALSQNLESSVAGLNLFSRHDLEVVRGWNAKKPNPNPRTLPKIFRESVERHLDAVAILETDKKTTYHQLERQASALALYLHREWSVKHGDHVAVYMERGTCAIVSMLAISMCGAVFIPLDLDNPIQRLETIMENSNSRLILCSPGMSGNFTSEQQNCCVVDEKLIRKIPQAKDLSVLPYVDPADIVYIIYTSGTSGKPKGVSNAVDCFCPSILT
jgi:hypothetical protein